MLVVGHSSAHLDDTIDMNSKLDPKNSTWVKVCCSATTVTHTCHFNNNFFPLHLGHSDALLIFCLPFMSDLLEITGSGIAGQMYFLSPNPWCQSTPDNISVIAVPFTCCLSSLNIF